MGCAQINGRTDRRKDNTLMEKAFVCFVAMCTLIFMTVFISSLTTKMMEIQKHIDEQKKGQRLLNRYLDNHKTSWTTAYFAKYHVERYVHVHTQMQDESAILEYLPPQMQGELLYEVRAPILRVHGFFEDFETLF